MSVSENLVRLRKEKGLSQLELAEMMNISRQSISRWEVGSATPSTGNLLFLSELYDVSIDKLLGGGGSDTPCADDAQSLKTDDLPEKKRKGFNIWHILISCFILLCVFAVGILVGLAVTAEKTEKDIIPMDELNIEDWSDKSVGTFSIDW
jgi:transcriptional regulator with XRE-family HTH domain